MQLQEYVEGADYRVHVIGTEAFVTRLESADADYRCSAFLHTAPVVARPARLTAEVVDRCVVTTRGLGLVVSGIDFKESVDGRLVALELNPYPQLTFYEDRSGQPITRAVVDCLLRNQTTGAANLVA